MSDQTDCQEGFTALDLLHAQAYADAQIAKMKCTDPEIVEKVCAGNAGGGQCITWNQDNQAMTFPKPESYYINNSCKTDTDCYQGKCVGGKCICQTDSDCIQGSSCLSDPNAPQTKVCAYAPSDVAAGHCLFTNANACLTYGDVPYTCNCGAYGNSPGNCEPKPKKDLKPYLEWHLDKNNQGKCILGNFTLRQWCENPCTRCVKNKSTGKYPPACYSGPNSRGVTDVPPFYYDANKSACYMTKDYCDWYAMDYNKKSCSSNADCPGNDNYCDTRSEQPHCTGPDAKCYLPSGDKLAEFIVGKTLFYMMKKGTTCQKESYQGPEVNKLQDMTKEIGKQFSQTSTIACGMYDKKLIRSRKLVGKDFAGPGINLYTFQKTDDKFVTGFDPDEVEKKYPDCVERHPDGSVFICVDRNEIKGDKNLKRIYLTLNSGDWMSKMIFWGVQLGQMRKKNNISVNK
uniref:Uncharacterized protein n=1 Tax=viral metagenome TaxID=1070528 RepID=A0A6C0EKX0_9ZZZZ